MICMPKYFFSAITIKLNKEFMRCDVGHRCTEIRFLDLYFLDFVYIEYVIGIFTGV